MPGLSSQSALVASGRNDPKRSGAFPDHEPRHMVQTESSHCLSIHLQNFITDAEQTDVRAFPSTVTYFLYIHTWRGNKDRQGHVKVKEHWACVRTEGKYRILIEKKRWKWKKEIEEAFVFTAPQHI